MRNRLYFHSLILLTLVVAISGCGGSKSDESANSPTTAINANTDATEGSNSDPSIDSNDLQPNGSEAVKPPKIKENLFPIVDIETSLGTIRVKLNAEKAPMSVDNFLINYVDRKFYDGTIFHYVEKDFIAIAGGYTTDLKAKAVRSQIRNEAANGLKNKRGTIAMSRHPDYINSATSQFFFNLADNPSLDHKESKEEKDEEKEYGYCVFGQIVSGIEVLDKIAQVNTVAQGDFPFRPKQAVVIKSVTRVKEPAKK